MLSGSQKAVVLLLSIGEDRATDVLRHLEERHVRDLSDALDAMTSVSEEQVDEVYREFADEQDSYAIALKSGSKIMRRIASRALGTQRADDLLAKDIQAPEPLRLLNRIEPETLASLLSKEHAQSLAALLAHVDVDKAASVLEHLPADNQADVVRRMASLEAIPHTTIQHAERALREELALVSEAKVASIDGLKRAAELISRLDKDVSDFLIDSIDEASPDLALSIKRSMFTFEDLLKIDNRDMQNVLKEVSSDQLRNGLKTASFELRDHMLSAMSRRAAEMMMDDLESMGPIKLSAVEEAQSAIVEIALQLANDGKITIAGAGGEEMV